MFSYRHAFHAGNHADVLKHTVLIQLLRHLTAKDSPFWVIDTHAGAGIYALGFCQNRGIATEGLSLVQKHVVDPETHLPTSIALELTLPPGFPEKYRPAIVRAVEGCKVKKTIFSGLSFTVKET